MNNICIYYKDELGLTFNTKEHIFPKAIGGTIRLDKGIVSDKANQLFSKRLEIKTLRETKIAQYKYKLGPKKKPSKERFRIKPPIDSMRQDRELDSRTLGKIVFNVLAKLKGKEYVLKTQFDEFRNWILNGNNDWYHTPLLDEKILSRFSEIIPVSAHSCIFTHNGQYVIAMICIYGQAVKTFAICKKFDNSFMPAIGYICDWENKNEYTLLEAITDNGED